MYLAEDKEAKLGMTEPSNPQSFRVRKQYIFDFIDNIQKMIEEESGTLKEITTEVNNLNQYVRFGTLTLRYDRRGNLTEKGGKKFSYDWAGRLISVEEGTNRVTFKYDALGRRTEKVSSQGTTRYYYDGWNVIEERDANDRVKAQYVYSGLDQPVEMRRYTKEGTKTYYFHQNSIGSVSFITDETGGIIEKVEYEPYGKPRFLIPTGNPESPWQIQEQSSIGNNCLFQGRELDQESGLYNFRMRYYDPELGRFFSRDPEGYEDSMNLYQAFRLNPINFLDPMGLATGSFRVYQHPVKDVRDIPNNPFYRKGVTRLRNEESNIQGHCEFLGGKWHPKFDFNLTFDLWYLDIPGSMALKHEWTHLSDLLEAYHEVKEQLFLIETSYDKFSFKDKNSCERLIQEIRKFVISYMESAAEDSEAFRDFIPAPFLRRIPIVKDLLKIILYKPMKFIFGK